VATSWGEWSEWGDCISSTECGHGKRVRHRLCPNVGYCQGNGSTIDYISCNVTCTGKTVCLLYFPFPLLGRPAYLSADLGFTAILLSSLFLLFRNLISKLAKRNSAISGHMVGSKCHLKMNVRNLRQAYPLPLQIRGPKQRFFHDFAT